MNWKDMSARTGMLAILLAILLRMVGAGGLFGHAAGIFSQPELASFLIYSETGRQPTLSGDPTVPPTTTGTPTTPTAPSVTEPAPTVPTPTVPMPTVPTPTVPAQPQRPVFGEADMQYVSLVYSGSDKPDAKKLLLQKLNWNLTGDKPTILIIHSHATEAYTKTPDAMYDNYAAYRTEDDRYNMISIGDELTRLLEEKGLNVIHDRTAFDYRDYDNAYANSRKAVQAYLKEYTSIKMVMDLHRDAVANADGTQWATRAEIDGQSAAQLMFVLGTDALGDSHSGWRTNLSVAEKLLALVGRQESDVCRQIRIKGKSYNHDLAVGAMIVEVGAAGNTHAEALAAMPVLADAIYALSKGAN